MLTLKAKIPGIDEAEFQALAHAAEKNCPVSKLLKAEIGLDAQLIAS
jgi:osmotically inducible protein OsmC